MPTRIDQRSRQRARGRHADVMLYEELGPGWWSSDRYLIRALKALVKPRMKWFSHEAGSWSGRRVLDVGCAGGFMSEAIAREGAEVIGLDPALPAIAAARAHAAAQHLRIAYQAGLAEAIPLADASMDRVVCVDVFEHVGDLRRCCREIARVLKPGGLLLFDTINRTAIARWVVIGLYEGVLRMAPRGTHHAEQFVRPDEMRHHLEAAGLRCGRFAGLGPLGFNWRREPVFARWPILAVNYLGTATRI
jgi:2-polyprenyl-6-hydroxyphenyl methylase/3-demethylubiquinone-9 3-methyltransferase